MPADGEVFTWGKAGGSADGQIVHFGGSMSAIHCETWVDEELNHGAVVAKFKLKDVSLNGTFAAKGICAPLRITTVTVLEHGTGVVAALLAGSFRCKASREMYPTRR
jgi:hypothetical protein